MMMEDATEPLEAPPPLPPPMSAKEIRRGAEALMSVSFAHPNWTASQRERYAQREYPQIVATYPKLAEMCMTVDSPQSATHLRSMLNMMLAEMDRIDAAKETFEGACSNIGRHLGEIYLPAAASGET